MIYLANRFHEKRMISGVEIAEKLDIPLPFTVKILQELARERIILSSKGPKGGFYLNDDCKAKSIHDIVVVIDGEDIFTTCGIGLKQCSDEHPCPFHTTFKQNREKLKHAFSSKLIGDFCTDTTFNMYFISDL